MSDFSVTSITLPPVPDVHGGTGTFQSSNWLVAPASVPPPGNLAFFGKTVHVTTMLFEIASPVVPNWFGVAVPPGITDFTSVNIFFHPTPAQAGYHDNEYQSKTGKWPDLFYYMERLGYQIDGAERDQVLIMPFMTEARTDSGILPANWQQIIPDILTGARNALMGDDGTAVTVQMLVVSSFSAGIIYSDSFRRHAPGISSVLSEVWDLDGNLSSFRTLSQNLRTTAGCRVIQYDQIPSNDLVSFHVPQPRWADYVDKPTTVAQVHGLIRDFMFMHGATITAVGGQLVPPSTGTATHTATHTATFSGTGTQTGTATHTATGTATHTATGTATHTASGTATHTATATGSGTVAPAAPAVPAQPASLPAVPSAFPPAARPPLVPAVPAPARPPAVPPHVPPGAQTPMAPAAPLAPVGGPPAVPLAPATSLALPGTCTPPPDGCASAELTAIVGSAATVAQTAISAITAVAAQRKRHLPRA